MSTLADLAVMQKLVEMKYQQQQESFAHLLNQERHLRDALHRLDQQLSDSRHLNDAEQRTIGADILWQSWIGRKKRELNLKLAQVLAIKERHIAQVRKAYGKMLVTQSLFEQETTKKKREMAQSQLDRAITPKSL